MCIARPRAAPVECVRSHVGDPTPRPPWLAIRRGGDRRLPRHVHVSAPVRTPGHGNGRDGMEARRTDARVAAVVAARGEGWRAGGGARRGWPRRSSASAEDAEDAVQRGLEIYVRRLARVDPATELAWLKVVVRHEALAVGRARGETVAGEFDLDAQPAPDQRSLDELVAG